MRYKQVLLPQLKTFVYTIPRNVERQAKITKMLNNLGFTNWQFYFGSDKKQPYFLNIHDDWDKILQYPSPFIILEDDAEITDFYCPELHYPDDAELIYLGGSVNGELFNIHEISKVVHKNQEELMFCTGLQDWWPEFMVYTDRTDHYIRTYNMHSTHAMLFINDNINQEMRKIIVENSQLGFTPFPRMRTLSHDKLFADHMYLFKTYCLKNPFWYQNDGKNNIPTSKYYIGISANDCNIFNFRTLKYAYYAKANGTNVGDNRFRVVNGVFQNPESIDVTERLNNIIKQGMLVGDRLWGQTFVTNELLGGDPFPGHYKFLHLNYNSGAIADWNEGREINL